LASNAPVTLSFCWNPIKQNFFGNSAGQSPKAFKHFLTKDRPEVVRVFFVFWAVRVKVFWEW